MDGVWRTGVQATRKTRSVTSWKSVKFECHKNHRQRDYLGMAKAVRRHSSLWRSLPWSKRYENTANFLPKFVSLRPVFCPFSFQVVLLLTHPIQTQLLLEGLDRLEITRFPFRRFLVLRLPFKRSLRKYPQVSGRRNQSQDPWLHLNLLKFSLRRSLSRGISLKLVRIKNGLSIWFNVFIFFHFLNGFSCRGQWCYHGFHNWVFPSWRPW